MELPRGDWAQTILRQFFNSAYQYYLYQYLQQYNDRQLSAIAERIKEVSYHLRWSSEWVIRLGDGTEESNERMVQALQTLWPYTGEMFIPAPYETELVLTLQRLQVSWQLKIKAVLEEATLDVPEKNIHAAGRQDRHPQ